MIGLIIKVRSVFYVIRDFNVYTVRFIFEHYDMSSFENGPKNIIDKVSDTP